MKTAFKKYFICVVLFLIGGLVQLHANDNISHNATSLEQEVQTSCSQSQFELHPYTGAFYKKLGLSDLTESEEQEEVSEDGNSRHTSDNGSILTAFFYVFAWQSTHDNTNVSLANHKTTPHISHCKRYIQFEVFRI